MTETSTTPVDDPSKSDAPAESTTATDPNTGTDNQPADKGDNLDESSKSTDTSSTDDDKSTDTKTSDKTDDTPASQFDEDLDDWITKRGLKVPETDAEKQSLQDLRNEQREFTRERQAKKDAEELAKTRKDAAPEESDDEDDELDPIEKRQNEIERQLAEERTTRMQSEFYTDNKVTPDEHKALIEVMKEKFAAPTTPEGKKRAFELWSSVEALPDLLDLARARVAKTTQSTVAEEAAREEREKIERESNASSPGRSASQHTPSGNKDVNSDAARLERFKARYNK